MVKHTKPIKGLTHGDITQTYHSGHEALDIVKFKQGLINGYGVPLCAVEDSRVDLVIGNGYTPDSTKNLERGYGVWLTGLETGVPYVMWHTLPYIPISVGDIIRRGKIVAWVGNSGLVRAGGMDVPLDKRTANPYPGTHLHLEYFSRGHTAGDWRGQNVNPLDYIDWSLEPTYTLGDYIAAMVNTVANMVKVVPT